MKVVDESVDICRWFLCLCEVNIHITKGTVDRNFTKQWRQTVNTKQMTTMGFNRACNNTATNTADKKSVTGIYLKPIWNIALDLHWRRMKIVKFRKIRNRSRPIYIRRGTPTSFPLFGPTRPGQTLKWCTCIAICISFVVTPIIFGRPRFLFICSHDLAVTFRTKENWVDIRQVLWYINVEFGFSSLLIIRYFVGMIAFPLSFD